MFHQSFNRPLTTTTLIPSVKVAHQSTTPRTTPRRIVCCQLGKSVLPRVCGYQLTIALQPKPPTMSAKPQFFSQPLRYLRWAHVAKPAIFYSLAIGSLGPVLVLAVPPLRYRFGDPQRPQIPMTYPSSSPSTVRHTILGGSGN